MKIIKYMLSAVLCLAYGGAKAQVYETVELKSGEVYKGYISEQDFIRGTMRFVNELGTEIAGIRMQNVATIEKKKRVGNYDSGLLELVYHDSTTVSGQIVKIIPGREYMVVREDGTIDTIPSSRVEKVDKKVLYADGNLFEQSPFIETIIIKDGKITKELEGVITTQSYNAKETSIIMTKEGVRVSFSMNDASIYKKRLNPNYKKMPQYILRTDDEMCIDGGKPNYERIQAIKVDEQIPAAYTMVKVEGGDFSIACPDTISEDVRLVQVTTSDYPELKGYRIIEQENIGKAIRSNESRKGNGFIAYFFKGIRPGKYVAYYEKAKKGVLIEIK